MKEIEKGLDQGQLSALKKASSKLIEAIKELRPIAEVYQKPYTINNRALCLIIEQEVIPEIGEEVFHDYCKEIIKKFKTSKCNSFSLNQILQFIFGSTSYAEPHQLIARGYKIPHFSRGLYGAILPEILRKNRCNIRYQLYKLCEYDQEEIDHWEDYFKKNKHKGRIVHTACQYLTAPENVLSQEEAEKLSRRIDRFLEPYYRKRKVPLYQEVRDFLKEDDPSFKRADPFLKASVDTVIIQKVNDLKDHLFTTQAEHLDPEQDKWEVYIKKAKALNLRTVDFTSVKSSQLKEELKAVAQEYFKDYKKIPRFIHILNYIHWFEERFGINSLSEINKDHLLVFFNYLQTGKKLKIGTLAQYKTVIKQILDIYSSLNKPNESYANPAAVITFYNVNRQREKTEVIPKEVVQEIEKYLPELPLQYRLFYELLMQTGWRLQEVADLSPTAFREVPEFPDLIEVTGRIPKTGRARKESGLKEYLSCFIDRSLYEEITDFINDTKQEREFYHISTCFYGLSRGYPEAITCTNLSEVINRLIREHNITYNEELWRFTTRQTRKTIAVWIVKEGSPISCVQKQLGHLNQYTTQSYYTEVEQMTLSQKNKELYESTVETDKDTATEGSQIFYHYFTENPTTLALGLCDQSGQDLLCERSLGTGCEDCPNFCLDTGSLCQLVSSKEAVERQIKELTQCFRDKDLSREDYVILPEYQALTRKRTLLESTIEALENGQKQP